MYTTGSEFFSSPIAASVNGAPGARIDFDGIARLADIFGAELVPAQRTGSQDREVLERVAKGVDTVDRLQQLVDEVAEQREAILHHGNQLADTGNRTISPEALSPEVAALGRAMSASIQGALNAMGAFLDAVAETYDVTPTE